jgi:hypothetical protein
VLPSPLSSKAQPLARRRTPFAGLAATSSHPDRTIPGVRHGDARGTVESISQIILRPAERGQADAARGLPRHLQAPSGLADGLPVDALREGHSTDGCDLWSVRYHTVGHGLRGMCRLSPVESHVLQTL